VVDARDVTTAGGIFEACIAHLRRSTNGGRIQPLITVFAPSGPDAPGPRIHNYQLIRYAGYRADDGTALRAMAQGEDSGASTHRTTLLQERQFVDVLFGCGREDIEFVPQQHEQAEAGTSEDGLHMPKLHPGCGIRNGIDSLPRGKRDARAR
jgi:nitric oxide synthase oxygenase domain/subunit